MYTAKDRPKAVSPIRLARQNLRRCHPSAPPSNQSAQRHHKTWKPCADNGAGDRCGLHCRCREQSPIAGETAAQKAAVSSGDISCDDQLVAAGDQVSKAERTG